MLLLPLMLGCADIAKLQNLSTTVANPLVMVGAYIGIDPPGDPSLDMSNTEFSVTAAVTTILANATSAADMSKSPVTGVSATWSSPTNGQVDLSEGSQGDYEATSDNGIKYTDGEIVTISVDSDGAHSASVLSPPPAQFSIDPNHTTGVGVTVDLSGQDYDSAFVVVYDVLNGAITYDNRPKNIADIYNWTHGGGTTVVTIPGDAFGSESIYGLGVAGMKHSDPTEFSDTNTLLSTYACGKFEFYGVYTLPTGT